MTNIHEKEINKNQKKFTWSKIVVLCNGLLFVSTVVFVMYMYIAGKIDSAYDTTAIVTCVTVTGTIFGSNICWYSKKAASENHYKLRMGLYSDATQIRLQFNEEMMKLKKKYKMSDEDIAEIDESGDIDDMMNGAIQDVISELDTIRDDADSVNEIQQI